MMKNPLKRKKDNGNKELTMKIGAHQSIAEAQKPQTAEEAARMLGIDKHLMMDENIDDVLRGLTFRQYEDNEGNKFLYVDHRFASLLIFNSPLNRTSNISEKQARMQTLLMKRHLLRKLIKMSEADIDTDWPDTLEALQSHLTIAIEEAVKGKRAKMIKLRPRAIETRVTTGKEE